MKNIWNVLLRWYSHEFRCFSLITDFCLVVRWVQVYQIWNWTIKVALGWTTEGTELVPLRVYMQISLTQVRGGNTHITLRVLLWAVSVCVWNGVKSGLSVEWCRAKWREWGAEGVWTAAWRRTGSSRCSTRLERSCAKMTDALLCWSKMFDFLVHQHVAFASLFL